MPPLLTVREAYTVFTRAKQKHPSLFLCYCFDAAEGIWCMLAIAVERWRTLLSTNSRHRCRSPASLACKLIIIAGWTVSISYACILIFIQDMKDVPIQYEGSNRNSCFIDNQTMCGNFHFCYSHDPNQTTLVRNINLTTLVVIFIVPLCIISIIYTVLVTRLLRNAQQSEKANRGSCSIHRAKLRAMQAMILVVVIFAICWLPGHVFFVWTLSTNPHKIEKGAAFHRVPIGLRIMSDFVFHLVVTHHWIQVFIYPRYSRQLANATKETIHFISCLFVPDCCRRRCGGPGQRTPSNKSSKISNAAATVCITASV